MLHRSFPALSSKKKSLLWMYFKVNLVLKHTHTTPISGLMIKFSTGINQQYCGWNHLLVFFFPSVKRLSLQTVIGRAVEVE